jgi:hypothetical protein
MSSSWRTRCRGSASCRRPSARRADACWRIQQMHRAANARCRHLKCSLSRDRCGQQARARPAPTCRASAVAMQSVSHQREAAERQARPAARHRTRANSKQARVLGAAATAERGPDRHHHGIRRLAVALGAGVLCRVVRKKLGLKLASEKTDAGRAGSRFRTLRHNWGRLRPHRHDPHHAQAARRKRLIMNPNFPDGLLAGE